MNLLIIGAPGSGKGTNAPLICKDFGLVHISTGDIIRQNIKDETTLGLEAKSYVDEGKLVPLEIILKLVKNRISKPDCSKGVLFDGFPRTLVQYEEMKKNGINVDLAVYLDVNNEILIKRLTGRRVCSKCGEPYHISWMKTDRCTKCGGSLYQRSDDNLESISVRMETYEKETFPVIQALEKENKLVKFDASGEIEETYKVVAKTLKELLNKRR